MKIGTDHARDCGVRGTMKLAAHGAMAMCCLRKKRVDLESYDAAQATTAIGTSHGMFSSNI